jgi:ribosomal protein S18 acetylase RimI-like enzyme
MAFLCIDTDSEFRIANCPTGLIYTSERLSVGGDSIVYYILFICTKHQYKNMGYASILLNQFIERIRHKHHSGSVKIVLSSLDSAVTYYESYGFKWTRDDIRNYPKLLQIEKYEVGKEYFVMELVIS